MSVVIAPGRGVPRDLGRPDLPGSKSHAQRALVLASFLPGPWTIRNLPDSEDVAVLVEALRRCGARIDAGPRDAVVRGIGDPRAIRASVSLRDNGTALRVLAMVVPLLHGSITIDGSVRLAQRPLDFALDALRSAGVAVLGDSLPVTLDGRDARSFPASVDAALSTQAASGLLIAASLRGDVRSVTARRPLATGYLELTAHVIRCFGALVESHTRAGDLRFALSRGPGPSGEYEVPEDPSALVFPLTLAAMHGMKATSLAACSEADPHPDRAFAQDLARLSRPGPIVLDGLSARPDGLPALAALASLRSEPVRFTDLSALRHKESDRLRAMAEALAAAGAHAFVEGNDLIVCGPLAGRRGPRYLPCPPDHRVVMALALLGTALEGGVELPNEHSVAKSWPSFFEWLSRCASVQFG